MSDKFNVSLVITTRKGNTLIIREMNQNNYNALIQCYIHHRVMKKMKWEDDFDVISKESKLGKHCA